MFFVFLFISIICGISYFNFWLGFAFLTVFGCFFGTPTEIMFQAIALKKSNQENNFKEFFLKNHYFGLSDIATFFVVSFCGARFIFSLSIIYLIFSFLISLFINIAFRIYYYIKIIK